MNKFTKIAVLAAMAFSTLNAAAPATVAASAPAAPAVFDATYVKSTSAYANVQSGVSLAGDYTGQATCVLA